MSDKRGIDEVTIMDWLLAVSSWRLAIETIGGVGVDRNCRSDTTACGRTNHSPQSEGLRPERLGVGVPCEVSDLPIVGGRTGAVTISCA